jgi:SEL1 protein
MAAEQGNVEANLKIGDFHYYGLGGLNTSYARAGHHYRAASNLRHPRSMFNLGYMHQYGIGLPQDLHLAKRFFDMAVETHQEANVPVALALANLWMQRTAHDYFGIELDQWPGGVYASAPGLMHWFALLNPVGGGEGGADGGGGTDGEVEASADALGFLDAMETDTVLIFVLIAILGICMGAFRRRQDEAAAREGIGLHGGDQAQAR